MLSALNLTLGSARRRTLRQAAAWASDVLMEAHGGAYAAWHVVQKQRSAAAGPDHQAIARALSDELERRGYERVSAYAA